MNFIWIIGWYCTRNQNVKYNMELNITTLQPLHVLHVLFLSGSLLI